MNPKNFNAPEARSLKLMEVMGYDKHRLVEPGVCVSDLAVFALQHLFDSGKLDKHGFDALILVTQSPDYLMPPTSSVIHGRLQLSQDLFCLDISQERIDGGPRRARVVASHPWGSSGHGCNCGDWPTPWHFCGLGRSFAAFTQDRHRSCPYLKIGTDDS